MACVFPVAILRVDLAVLTRTNCRVQEVPVSEMCRCHARERRTSDKPGVVSAAQDATFSHIFGGKRSHPRLEAAGRHVNQANLPEATAALVELTTPPDFSTVIASAVTLVVDMNANVPGSEPRTPAEMIEPSTTAHN